MYSKLDRLEKNELKLPVNAGSCVKLANYLNKESDDNKQYFSQHEDHVSLSKVIEKIDNNKKTLKKNQEKFYSLSYNPSQKEIAHLVYLTTGKKVTDLAELTNEEKTKVFAEFRNYVRDCMDIYAKNFNRERTLNVEDLIYFGRIEEFRHYSYKDEEVRLGLKEKGQLKEGLNLHAHVVVSRMDATQTIALSPRAKSTGNTNLLNGKEVKNGFNMRKWQVECFEHFSNKFRYAYTADERFYEHSVHGKYKSQIKNKILHEVMEDMYEERKLLSGVKKINMIIHPSKKALSLYLMRKIKNILSENESVI